MIKKILKNILPYYIVNSYKEYMHRNDIIDKWNASGRPVPPPHFIKQDTIKEYKKKYRTEILVETGTFMGDMLEAQKNTFTKLFSIELDSILFENATKRFAGYNKIKILKGDSSKILPELLPLINKATLFWLDGHYCGENTGFGDKSTPIFEELDTIFKHNYINHVLLIDDARLFIGGDYPTIDQLREYISSKVSKFHFEVKDDIIRIHFS